MLTKTMYICGNCQAAHDLRAWVFTCQYCDKEICEHCMDSCATCKECAMTRTQEEIQAKFDDRTVMTGDEWKAFFKLLQKITTVPDKTRDVRANDVESAAYDFDESACLTEFLSWDWFMPVQRRTNDD